MKHFLDLKKGVDSFNFFLSTTAGNATVVLLMIVAYLPGISLFFAEIFQQKIDKYQLENGFLLSLLLGGCFAAVLVSGTYVAAINRYTSLTGWLAFIDGLLSFCSYSFMLLPVGVDWSSGLEITRWLASFVGIFIIAAYPAFIIATVSERLASKYQQAKVHEGLNEQVDKIMNAALIQEVKTYSEKQDLSKVSIGANLSMTELENLLKN